jgi:hypothetical protein
MRILTALLVGIALWLATVATAQAEDKGLRLESRIQAGAADLRFQLRLETDPAVVLQGGLGAGGRQYNFHLRLDPRGVHLDTRPGPGGDPLPAPRERSPAPPAAPTPPGLEDV